MPATTEQIESRLTNLAERLDDARYALQNGQVRNLEPLKKEVSDLCRAIPSMKGEDAQQLQPAILGLISQLEILEDELRLFHAGQKANKT